MTLIEKIISGDEQAITSFYQEYAKPLLRYLQNRVPHEEATEILNDIFLEAIDAMHTLKKETNLRAWLYKIAHNKTVDYYRKKKLKSVILSQLPFLELVASEIHNPEFQIEKDKIRDTIEETLGGLSHTYRRILQLHYEDQKPVKEIANMFRLTPKATESLLYRARQKFMKTYERA